MKFSKRKNKYLIEWGLVHISERGGDFNIAFSKMRVNEYGLVLTRRRSLGEGLKEGKEGISSSSLCLGLVFAYVGRERQCGKGVFGRSGHPSVRPPQTSLRCWFHVRKEQKHNKFINAKNT
jgi:hypothetical protein